MTTKELWFQWYNATTKEERDELQPKIEKELGYSPKWVDLAKKNPLKQPKTQTKQSSEGVLEKMNVNMPAEMITILRDWESAVRNSHKPAYDVFKDDFTDKDTRIALAGLTQNFATFYAISRLTEAINKLNTNLNK